ncbi:MAG: 50S ribosomal protein L29 [Janthinobacterium lividum]
MELDKIRGLNEQELKDEEVRIAEQLFRIRFAQSLGKQEGVGKIRGLKVDIARLKTIARERALQRSDCSGREGIIHGR